MAMNGINTRNWKIDRERFLVDYCRRFGRTAKDAALEWNRQNPTRSISINYAQEIVRRHRQEALQSIHESAKVHTALALRRLLQIALFKPTDVATWDDDGLHLKPSHELGEAEMAGIKRIWYKEGANGTKSVSVEFHNSSWAAREILKRYPLPTESTLKVQHTFVAPEEIKGAEQWQASVSRDELKRIADSSEVIDLTEDDEETTEEDLPL